MHLARILDQKAENYVRQGKAGPTCIIRGHDGIQLILGLSFRPGKDFLFPYYRDLLTSLAAGITTDEIIQNGISKAGDVASGGRHMSKPFRQAGGADSERLVGHRKPCQHATGVRGPFAGTTVTRSRSPASGIPPPRRGMSLSHCRGGARETPAIFVIQNNKYGISVPIHEGSVNPDVSHNFSGLLNLRIVKCDGTNVFDCWRGMQEALDAVRSGAGPALLHADCVRINAHSNSDRTICTGRKRRLKRPARVITQTVSRIPDQRGSLLGGGASGDRREERP